MQAIPVGHECLGKTVHLRHRRQVGAQEVHIFVGCAPSDARHEVLSTLCTASRDDDRRPHMGKSFRHGCANAACGARHQADPAL